MDPDLVQLLNDCSDFIRAMGYSKNEDLITHKLAQALRERIEKVLHVSKTHEAVKAPDGSYSFDI